MSVTRLTSSYGKSGLNSYLLNKKQKALGLYKKKTSQWLASRGLQLSKLSNDDLSFNYNIVKKENIVNKKIGDSEGNTLSQEQIDFFKDSKVRDENGNLKVMYHSSNNKFSVFDLDFANLKSLFFLNNID